mgnify:FL=1
MTRVSVWKVLGGVAAGVGAVVALPVAGPVGAITGVGAALGAAGGALGGLALDRIDARKRQASYDAGYRAGMAESAAIIQAHGRVRSEDADYFQLVLAMVAVGLAAAACDGVVGPEEVLEIREFSAGLAHARLPEAVRHRIDDLVARPPDFAAAMGHVAHLPDSDHDAIEAVIRLVIEADGIVNADEAAFLAAWHQHRSAA